MIAVEESIIKFEGVDVPATLGYLFSSDNPEIAEVDAGGKVIAHGGRICMIFSVNENRRVIGIHIFPGSSSERSGKIPEIEKKRGYPLKSHEMT